MLSLKIKTEKLKHIAHTRYFVHQGQNQSETTIKLFIVPHKYMQMSFHSHPYCDSVFFWVYSNFSSLKFKSTQCQLANSFENIRQNKLQHDDDNAVNTHTHKPLQVLKNTQVWGSRFLSNWIRHQVWPNDAFMKTEALNMTHNGRAWITSTLWVCLGLSVWNDQFF